MNIRSFIKSNRSLIVLSILLLVIAFITTSRTIQVLASSTSTFNQTISAGTLSVDIVDGAYSSVASPSVTLSAATFNASCQTSTGTFGTATEQIYVENPDAAANGWSVTIAASSPTAFWDSAGTDFDFNDDTGAPAGCSDGGDTDSLAGQLTIDPSGGTLAIGQCGSCTVTSVSKGSSAAFLEGTTDSITLLTGAAASDDVGDWTLQGVSISQQIPPAQPAAADYSLDLTLTITAL